MKMENVWWVKQQKPCVCKYSEYPSGSHFYNKEPRWFLKKRFRRSKPKGLGIWRVLPPNNTEMINVDHLAKAVSHPKVASKIFPRSYPHNLVSLYPNIPQRHERPLATTVHLSLPWGFGTMDPQFYWKAKWRVLLLHSRFPPLV